MLFLNSLFGYLSMLIVMKWCQGSKPDLYHVMIYMFLSPSEPLGENQLFWGQTYFQVSPGTLLKQCKKQGEAGSIECYVTGVTFLYQVDILLHSLMLHLDSLLHYLNVVLTTSMILLQLYRNRVMTLFFVGVSECW